MPHVFVSYVRANQQVVDRLVRDLRSRGVDVWLDRERIEPGQRWRHAIRAAIGSGALFLACFSPEYAKRDRTHMNEELTLAIDELRARSTDRAWFVALVFPGGEVPDRAISTSETLRDLQWLDMDQGWGSAIDRLVQIARKANATVGMSYVEPPPPPKPPSPETGFKNLDEVRHWMHGLSAEDVEEALQKLRVYKDKLDKELHERLLSHEIMYRADWPEEDQEAMNESEWLEEQIELIETAKLDPAI